MLSNYKAEIFLKSYYMNDPPPPLQMSITYQFMYCIFVFFYCSLHQSIILLILIEMSYHLYIFFKTFTMYIYMYQCVCAYKIQMHNISEIKWYKAVWNIFHPEVWKLCIIYFIWKYFKSTGMFSFSENVRYVASFYW